MGAESPAFWLLGAIAALTIGLSKGGLPVVGMLAVPVLALNMDPVQAAGLLLPVYVVSDMFGLSVYRRAFSKPVLRILVPASAIGIFLGWWTVGRIEAWQVTAIIGLIGAVFALYLLLRRDLPAEAKPPNVPLGLFWGTVAGYTSFISHAGAPPYQVYVLPLRLEKMVFAGTSTVLFAWINLVKLPVYWNLGMVNPASLKQAAILAIPAVVGVFAGLKLVKIIPQKQFFQLVTWALLLVSVKLLWDAFAAWAGYIPDASL